MPDKNTPQTEATETDLPILNETTTRNLLAAIAQNEYEQDNLTKINYKGHLGGQTKEQAATIILAPPETRKPQIYFKGESQAPPLQFTFPKVPPQYQKEPATTPAPPQATSGTTSEAAKEPELRSEFPEKIKEHLQSGATPEPGAPADFLERITEHLGRDLEHLRNQKDPETARAIAEREKLTAPYEALKKQFVDPDQHRKPPAAALRINGKTAFIPGEVFYISGQAKARKSFLLSIFAAALAHQEGRTLFGGALEGNLPPHKRKILVIDTEQAAYHTAISLKRARALCSDADASNIVYAHLSGKRPAELLTMLHAAAELHPDLGALIIDNGSDLLERGENDEQEASAVASTLNAIAQQYSIAIGVIVHNARTTGSGDAAGHLGTRLARKAALHIVVSKAPGLAGKTTSTTEIKRCRWPEPEPISFEIERDDLGTPFLVPYIAPKSEKVQERRLS